MFSARVREEAKSQIRDLQLYFKELEKGKQIKPHANRRKEIITLTAEINRIGDRNTIGNSIKPNACYLNSQYTY